MSFQLTVTGVDELSRRPLLTEVAIERSIYEHSVATVRVRWDEHEGIAGRPSPNIAARALNCPLVIEWKNDDLAETVECFRGYVDRVQSEREHAVSYLTLHGISTSKKADQAPRYRAFQACTLLDICEQIRQTEPLIKIQTTNDLNFDIPLSVQYNETDWAYLSRMLHAWGIPVAIAPKTGEILLGARGTASSGAFPDVSWGGWVRVVFSGDGTRFYSERKAGGGGPTSAARGKIGAYSDQIKPKATEYFPIEDAKYVRPAVDRVSSQTSTAAYHVTVESDVLAFAPGEVVKFEGQDHLIRRVRIAGDPRIATATQTFELQPFTLPYQPDRRVPAWPLRAVWAYVKNNQDDPMQAGRIQVEFEWEALDKRAAEQVWLPTVTPYGGGKNPADGKAGTYRGFYALPEVGERVLVQFLGEWDSEAVVVGTVRQAGVDPKYNAHDTKRWTTPSGNEIALTTKGGKDIVRIRCQDKIVFESKIEGGKSSVFITPSESDGDRIHFQQGGGMARLDVTCSGQINLKAAQKLHLEGSMVQIKASGGNVNIDGAPNVMINCVPLPVTPLQTQKFEETKMTTRSKPRKLPTPAVGTAASASSTPPPPPSAAPTPTPPAKKPTWIEVSLKDADGNPISGEKYRVKTADGKIIEGRLNADGKARVSGIEPGTSQVSFPDRDAGDWKSV